MEDHTSYVSQCPCDYFMDFMKISIIIGYRSLSSIYLITWINIQNSPKKYLYIYNFPYQGPILENLLKERAWSGPKLTNSLRSTYVFGGFGRRLNPHAIQQKEGPTFLFPINSGPKLSPKTNEAEKGLQKGGPTKGKTRIFFPLNQRPGYQSPTINFCNLCVSHGGTGFFSQWTHMHRTIESQWVPNEITTVDQIKQHHQNRAPPPTSTSIKKLIYQL